MFIGTSVTKIAFSALYPNPLKCLRQPSHPHLNNQSWDQLLTTIQICLSFLVFQILIFSSQDQYNFIPNPLLIITEGGGVPPTRGLEIEYKCSLPWQRHQKPWTTREVESYPSDEVHVIVQVGVEGRFSERADRQRGGGRFLKVKGLSARPNIPLCKHPQGLCVGDAQFPCAWPVLGSRE